MQGITKVPNNKKRTANEILGDCGLLDHPVKQNPGIAEITDNQKALPNSSKTAKKSS